MRVTLRRLTIADVGEHLAGEDEATVRWLSGKPSTLLGTRTWVEQLGVHARTGKGPQGFGILVDERLAGYVEGSASVRDGLAAGDVNISYAVHPWARGRGVAVEAVGLMCAFLAGRGIGSRAAIRVEPANKASVRVAVKSGFAYARDFHSLDDKPMSLYLRPL